MRKIIIFIIMFFMFLLSSCNNKNIDYYKDNVNSIVELKCEYGDNDSYGTAVCVNKDGYLITNAHVVTFVKAGERITFDSYKIRYSFDEEYIEVLLITYDQELDLALLKTDDSNYIPISFGKIDEVKIGDIVYSLGNSQNQGLSLAKGIISKTRVNIVMSNRTATVIASDAYIAEGNSGGALINENNQLIGITSFRLKDDFGNTIYGMGYSIPIDIVENFIIVSINETAN